jgi:peroxiredoxin
MNNNNKCINRYLAVLLIGLFLSIQTLAYEPDEGQLAPDFEITQSDGSVFSLSDYKGKQSVYVVFWNSWCHYCMKKIPKLLAAQKNLADDIKIIAVNTSRDDSVEEMQAFKKRFNITYSLAFDHGKGITQLYNVHGVPTEFIVDINGIIKHRDGVPDRLEDHIASWNQVNNSTTQLIHNSINVVAYFFNKLNTII